MARAAHTPVGITKTGYNLTDSSDFSTLVAGAGNGVEFTFNTRGIIILKNDSGGAAVFTIKAPGEAKFSDKGITVPDATVSVANNKSYVYQPTTVFKQSDSKVYIECDVAGKVLALSPQ